MRAREEALQVSRPAVSSADRHGSLDRCSVGKPAQECNGVEQVGLANTIRPGDAGAQSGRPRPGDS